MLRRYLERLIRTGGIAVIFPDGRRHCFGPDDPRTTIRIADRRTLFALAANPDLSLGEAYMDGRLSVEDGSLAEFLAVCSENLARRGESLARVREVWRKAARRLRQLNGRTAAAENVQHHYDLSRALYQSFLDRDMQYSCAYFAEPGMTLDEAQEAKKAHIAAKLYLSQHHQVLDIGCGWGGLALYLARTAGVRVHGITLSREQLEVCRLRAAAEGLADKVSFELADYRDVTRTYDRIVSVGMFEHVGVPNFPAFFERVSRLLAPDGVALIHAIGRAHGPSTTSAFIRKYIFPGGYAPALSQVLPAIEHSGLFTTDVEILRLHYARTLELWRQRFLANLHRLDEGHDARFARMWEFYLAASEMSFRYFGFMIFQIQLAAGVAALPLTRSYMVNDERARFEDGARATPRIRGTGTDRGWPQ